MNLEKNNRALRIGFLSRHDVNDRRSWSGIIHYLATALAEHAGTVVPLGPVWTNREHRLEALDAKLKSLFGKGYATGHNFYLSSFYARKFNELIRQNSIDVIFAPVASAEIALIRTSVPIVYMSDTTFAAMDGYYKEFSMQLGISRIEANLIERLAIRKAARIVYPSQWAANSAMKTYGAKPDRVHVFPMGANLDDPPTANQVRKKPRVEHVRLLFVGVDWERKGGRVAFDTLQALQQMGIPATLSVIGCVPPAEFAHQSMTVIPFLNRNNPKERIELAQAYLNADLFILPTQAECMGIVFCEAAAFGLPSFASATGGVPSIIEDGHTGHLFPIDATAADYASSIAAVWRAPGRLTEMAMASREKFERELNWDAWGKSASRVIARAVVSGSRHFFRPY